MKESISVNNKLLSEYLKTADQIELENEIKQFNSEVKINQYRKPKLKMPDLKERNGKPKVMQEEINLRNRDQLVIEYQHDYLKMMVVYLIGGYKDQWPTDSRIVTTKIQEIFDRNKIKTRKSLYHGIKMAVGRIRLSKFGQVYFLYRKGTNQHKSSFQMNQKAFELKPEETFALLKQPIDFEHKTLLNLEESIKIPSEKKENQIIEKLPNLVEEKQIIINFHGAVTINFNR